MHVFQPFPIDLLEINPFTKIGKEWALVTAGNKKKANTMTISWGGVGVLWGKNVAYIFIRDSRYTKEFVDQGEFFSVGFFNEKYRDALSYCGAHSGKDVNKIENSGLTLSFAHGIPYMDESNLVLLCQKMATVPITEETFNMSKIKDKWYADGDFHTMYVAEIIEVLTR